MCGIDCAKQSVGRARSPKSDFGVVGRPGYGGKNLICMTFWYSEVTGSQRSQ